MLKKLKKSNTHVHARSQRCEHAMRLAFVVNEVRQTYHIYRKGHPLKHVRTCLTPKVCSHMWRKTAFGRNISAGSTTYPRQARRRYVCSTANFRQTISHCHCAKHTYFIQVMEKTNTRTMNLSLQPTILNAARTI